MQIVLLRSGKCVLFAENIICIGAWSTISKKSVLFAVTYNLDFPAKRISLLFAQTYYLHFSLIEFSYYLHRPTIWTFSSEKICTICWKYYLQQRAKRASEKISVICTSYYLHYWHSFGAKNIFGTLQRQKMPALILQGQIPFVTLQRRDFSPAALILQGKFPFMTLQRQKTLRLFLRRK